MMRTRPPPIYDHADASEHTRAAIRRYLSARASRSMTAPLVLIGPPGTGKTWDAAGIYWRARRAGLRQAWIDCGTIDLADRGELIAAAERVDWIYLDDVGSRTTEGAMGRICEIIAIRVGLKRPIVATLNADAAPSLPDRARSRLRSGLVIEYQGLPDRRIDSGEVMHLATEESKP